MGLQLRFWHLNLASVVWTWDLDWTWTCNLDSDLGTRNAPLQHGFRDLDLGFETGTWDVGLGSLDITLINPSFAIIKG